MASTGTTVYLLPAEATQVEVRLYYQTTSKEYVEFFRDENVTNSLGPDLHDAWVAVGHGAPVLMAEATTPVSVDPSGTGDTVRLPTRIQSVSPIRSMAPPPSPSPTDDGVGWKLTSTT